MAAHIHDLGDDSLASPVDAENLCKLLEVVGSSFTDGEDRVAKPTHAQVAELLIEELDSKLAGKQGDVLDDRKANAPLLIFCQLDDGREQSLGKEVDANDYY